MQSHFPGEGPGTACELGLTVSVPVAVCRSGLQVWPEQQLDSHITFLQVYAEVLKPG